jgi:hypothetical protein
MRKWLKSDRLRRSLVSSVAVSAVVLSLVAAPTAAVSQDGAAHASTASTAAQPGALEMSQRVRELIRVVEQSELPCGIRNELVSQLRLLDDALRSGNLAGARALLSAWRAWAEHRAGTGLLSASTNDVVQQRLALLEGRIGLDWPEKLKPTRNWPKLPQCGESSAVLTAGAEYTWDSNKTLIALTTALYMIPSPVGSLFAGLLTLMWPPSATVDVTDLVDQEILQYAVAQGGADFNAIQEENRQYWHPAMQVWLKQCGWTQDSPPDWQPPPGCGTPDARSDVVTSWGNMYADLVRTAAAMQLNSGGVDYRAELLPLYVQMENLLISHLQVGVINRANWWPTSPETQQTRVDQLKMHLETEPGDPPEVGDPIDPNRTDTTGVGYVEQVFKDNTTSNDPTVTDYPVRTDSAGRLNMDDWEARNAWARDQGTIQALYFSDIWPFMDPTVWPVGNEGFKQTRMIYSDPVGFENAAWHYYPDRDPGEFRDPIGSGNVSGPLALLEAWQDDSVGYLNNRPVVDAVRTTAADATTSPVMGDPTPEGLKRNWVVGLSSDDPNLMPIISVSVAEGAKDWVGGGTDYWPQGFQFLFPDGGVGAIGSFDTTNFRDWPKQQSRIIWHDFSYEGQVLATVKVLDQHQWKNIWGDVQDTSADCAVFGFRFADSY